MKARISMATARGHRRENQDCCGALAFPDPPQSNTFWQDSVLLEIPRQGLWACVADGIGSGHASRQAAGAACRGFASAFPPVPPEEDPDKAEMPYPYEIPGGWSCHADRPMAGLEQAEKAVNGILAGESDGGTTLVGAFLTAPGTFCNKIQLSAVGIGDSAAFLYDPCKAELTQLLLPQNRFYEHARRGEPTEPWEKRVLTAYLGMKLPEGGEIGALYQNSYCGEVWPGQKILLCSDGVYNGFSSETLGRLLGCRWIRAAHLAALAALRPRSDNCTAVLIELLG